MTAIIELLGGLVPALALLGALLAWAFATGAIHLWGATFGKLAAWLASVLPGRVSVLGHTIFPDLAGTVRSGNNAVLGYFQVWRAGAETEMAYAIEGFRLIWQANAEASDWIARETAATFDWLNEVKLPKWAKWAALAALSPTLVARMIQQAISHLGPRVVKITRAVVPQAVHDLQLGERAIRGRLARDEAAIRELEHAATVAAGATVTVIPKIATAEWPSISGVSQKVWRRMRAVADSRILAASVMAVALANVLGVRPGCVRGGGPLGKLARSFCGLPTHWLDDILGLVVDFLVLENICTVIPWLTTPFEEIATPLIGTLTKAGAGICDPNHYHDSTLPRLTLHTPPARAFTVLGDGTQVSYSLPL